MAMVIMTTYSEGYGYEVIKPKITQPTTYKEKRFDKFLVLMSNIHIKNNLKETQINKSGK